MAELEDKYSRFYRDTGIDLHAEIAAGGSEGGLENYYTKTETNGLLDDKANSVDLTALETRVDDLEDNPGGGGVTDHGALTGLADDDHPQYLNNTRGDVRYYTKAQVDTSLSGKSDTNHNHDSRYFTETEVTTLLSGKADNSAVENLDDRVTTLEGETGPDLTNYYNKTETNGLLDAKANTSTLTAHTSNTSNPHSVTKAQVGLSNVDNTSDLAKPVSTATQTALDGKAASAHNHAAGDINSGTLNIARIPTGTSGTTVALGNHTHTKADVGLANVDNTSDANKPVSTAQQTALNAKLDTTTFALQNRPGITGQPRAVKPSIPLTVDGQHSAFPGICKLPNGNLLLTWRQGTDHFTTRDGSIKTSISTDLGRTWSAASTAVAYAGDGVDYRDPSVSVSTDGTRVYLTYFKGTNSLAAAGCFLRISTNNGASWGSEIRIDNLPYAAICAPLLELAGGNLLAFFYGRSGAETQDSVWYARSTNNGASWAAPVRLANGTTDARHYQEPWAVRQGNNTVVFFRWGTSEIGKIHSTDATATTWQAASSQFSGTGRPAAVWTSYGNIIVTYRGVGTGIGGSTMIRSTSNATGTTWNPGAVMQTQLYGGMMTYTCPFEVNPGQIICPWSEEISGGASTSKMLITYINEGGGETPIGPIPNPAMATVTDYDKLSFATQFHQPDGSLSYPWQSGGGATTVINGILNSAVADNTPDNVIVNCGSLNQKVEAEFMWTGQSGFGIYLRWVDANNHILITPETNAGNLRIYTRIGGTITQRAVLADSGFFYESNWNKLTATIEGFRVKMWCNDDPIVQYLIDGGMNGSLQGTMVGIKLNAFTTGNTNQCRKFAAYAL